jgi:tRNA A-37 threonylcarbamoyl transferase component Bud32/tetratricopeptide (TPR) repeat protein
VSATGDPLVGRTIAQYDILARVGGGGMGVVYKARDGKLGRIVALKFLPQQWSHDEGAKQRFLREAQAASATNHPNICTIHDFETADDGQLFIVMAYYEGQTLKQRLETGPLPVEEALDIATQVADGLAKAHAQGIVHRDIKPGNLMLTEDGVRILDFGLATFADALKLTIENSTLGTAAYMSPEQVRGQGADARSDVWAVGVVLYEMLTGHVPFQGSHAEAIGYAIRNEAPMPLRSERPEASEDVERLVFRALHKEPSVRFPSGRELARALRQARGLTVPQELRTQAIAAGPAQTVAAAHVAHGERRRRMTTAVVALLLCATSASTWIWWPVDRVPVAVAPVANETGFSRLADYGPALTEELIGQLADLDNVRVLPYQQLLEIVRSFRLEGREGSREALQAIATHSGARVLIVPTLLNGDDGWKVRLEFRDPETGVNQQRETKAALTSLEKEAVYGLMSESARGVFDYFRANGPRRAIVAAALGGLIGRPSPSFSPRLRTLDAALSFEEGLSAYEQLEYAAARSAFAKAAERDPQNPTPFAWKSRVAALMRQDQDAVESADQARRLVTDDTRAGDRLFVEAVAAEARGDAAAAERFYRELIARYPDEPRWHVELGGFQDRRGMSAESVATYHETLDMDGRLVRPHLELCRLYSPSRLNEPALAREQGQQTLAMYTTLGNRGGEAQAHWCLADVFLVGSEDEKKAARQHAETALEIMKSLGYPFGLARAYNYLANVALNERKAAEAAALWERTLTAARQVEFVTLEARTLMNLGVASEALGKRSNALKYYQDSLRFSEKLGAEQDAAWNQINAATIMVEYGGNPDEGWRTARNALAVFEKLNDKNFEVLARRVTGLYYRNLGQRGEAEQELTRGRDLARERGLETRVTQMALELARLRYESNDYLAARGQFLQIEQRASGLDRIHARSELARTRARLGDFTGARHDLTRAIEEIEAIGDVGSRPLFYVASGEVAYESGQLLEARSSFGQAAALWTDDDLPETASIEARAYAGLIDAIQGQPARGRSAVLASLAQARQMRRVALEARCQVFLARIDVGERRFAEALRRMSEVSAEQERVLDPELRAQLHYWRGVALKGRGEADEAAAEQVRARQFLEELRALVSDSQWSGVLSRPDIRLISGEHGAQRIP